LLGNTQESSDSCNKEVHVNYATHMLKRSLPDLVTRLHGITGHQALVLHLNRDPLPIYAMANLSCSLLKRQRPEDRVCSCLGLAGSHPTSIGDLY
jgi:hypothetical protein